jgi:hypothetical protein
MAERDESRRSALRPVEIHRVHDDEPTTRLRDALAVLDAKLHASDGFDGIAGWLRRAEQIVGATSGEEIEETRREIRELIDRLLEINADVQNVARLKRFLS